MLMAVVIPYGDAQAHGSIAKSICFRRHKGKVILQKKPHRKAKGTPAQLAQQARFSDAWKAFHAISLWTLEYLQEKALLINSSASIIFLSQYLTDIIPSDVKNNFIKDITDLDIPELMGDETDDIQFRYQAVVDDPEAVYTLATIWDKANTFIDGQAVSPYDRLVIWITYQKAPPLIIPFDYPLLLWYKNFSDDPFVNFIRLPELTFPPPASHELRLGCEYVEASEIFEPENPHAADVNQYVEIKYDEAPSWREIGHRPCTIGWDYSYFQNVIPCLAIRIRFHNTGVNVYTSPDGWRTFFIWRIILDPVVELTIAFPAFTLQPDEDLSFYVALDTSLYFDLALTQLARYNGDGTLKLYVAWDFSVYWDKEMTQLANSPYFQPG